MDKSHNIVSGLWQSFLDGNYDSLGEIFQNQYNELYYYGLKLVPVSELVKDTIQDLFVDIWSRRQKMNGVKNIRAYLFVSVRRELLRRLAKLRKESSISISDSEPFVFSSEDFLIQEEDNSKTNMFVIESLDKLTERQREVIMLRFSHELEFSEIALVLEMNIQSVRNLLFRALDKVRNDLQNNGISGASDIDIILFTILQKGKANFFQG